MIAIITLKFLNTSLVDTSYTYDERDSCLIGRGDQCTIQIPNEEEFLSISREHCFLNINPPEITIRDMGSKQGTYINNQKIGQRPKHLTPEEAKQLDFVETKLTNEDTIRIGELLIQVMIDNPTSPTLETQIPDDSLDDDYNSEEEYKSKTTPVVGVKFQRKNEIIYTPPSMNDLGKFVKRWLKRITNMIVDNDDYDQSLLPIQGYYVAESIGRGAFGEVFLAIQEDTDREVALKVMLPEMATDSYQREKFMREVENTKTLKHDNIIQLLDYGFSEGIFFFTLEYCEIGNLTQYCNELDTPLKPQEALSLIIPLLDALDYAHDVEIPHVRQKDGGFAKGKGLIHRDINPNNILLTKKKDKLIPKLADFGLAKAFDNAGLSGLSRSGQHLEGTFQFMSREQVINFKYPQPTFDLWAIMACLYYLLTLEYPRDFRRGDDRLLTVLQKRPLEIKKRNPKIPQDLADLIDKALDDSGELYFKSAKQLKNDLLKVIKCIPL